MLFINMSLKSQNGSDWVNNWAKLDGRTYKHSAIIFPVAMHCICCALHVNCNF